MRGRSISADGSICSDVSSSLSSGLSAKRAKNKRVRTVPPCPCCGTQLKHAQYFVHLKDIQSGGVCRGATAAAAKGPTVPNCEAAKSRRRQLSECGTGPTRRILQSKAVAPAPAAATSTATTITTTSTATTFTTTSGASSIQRPATPPPAAAVVAPAAAALSRPCRGASTSPSPATWAPLAPALPLLPQQQQQQRLQPAVWQHYHHQQQHHQPHHQHHQPHHHHQHHQHYHHQQHHQHHHHQHHQPMRAHPSPHAAALELQPLQPQQHLQPLAPPPIARTISAAADALNTFGEDEDAELDTWLAEVFADELAELTAANGTNAATPACSPTFPARPPAAAGDVLMW
ncbi:hypothetical protein HYH02_010195 [Chlamydomonas schloesseri]|uniref:Uncharacterized protein n=1 Tax=Chlamydomonas schloesseri TaxID=2026947 RepID=A0A835TL40_9CHLO|nr:hypothetical protein HYH02_010195 [Chlamydomonas schloesseri]|eukprot:KAG2440616.1 hypothetical protein HYH02_010195 [Chlamydomonas schloesseri]